MFYSYEMELYSAAHICVCGYTYINGSFLRSNKDYMTSIHRYVTQKQERCLTIYFLNPILHTAWLDNHALTLKSNNAKYYFHEKSRFLHTFLKFCCESRKI